MSYLQMEEADLPDMHSGIISFWVKVQPLQNTSLADPWPEEWLPPHLDQIMGTNEVVFQAGSYWEAPPQQIGEAHIVTYPRGGGDLIPQTFRHRLVPLLCFGDPNQKYDRCQWNKRVLGPPVWVFGKGGVPQTLVAQYPELVAREKDIVPPSCIGLYNGRLRIILQTDKKATYTGYAWAQARSREIHIMTPISCQDIIHHPHPCSEPEGWVDFSKKYSPPYPNQFVGFNFYYDDVSMLECAGHPEAFIMDPDVQIDDGRWHHILLCFDLGSGGSSRGVYAEALGPEGNRPALPGPWGQYSGADGEYALAPLRCIKDQSNPSYEELACYGRPFETCGKHSPANDGVLRTSCKAWLCVDDAPLIGKDLNHAEAWETLADMQAPDGGKTGQQILDTLDPHAILPPNAFLAPLREIRDAMDTNKTGWERDYRTMLGGFTGPACKIDDGGEMRRYDYPRPKYEFVPGRLPTRGNPVALPAGTMIGDVTYNFNVELAELQIWANETLDFDIIANRRLFIGPKPNSNDRLLRPRSMRLPVKEIGRIPDIRLHFSGNWKKGYNTGSLGVRTVNPGPDQHKVVINAGQFMRRGRIDRVRPDPRAGQA